MQPRSREWDFDVKTGRLFSEFIPLSRPAKSKNAAKSPRPVNRQGSPTKASNAGNPSAPKRIGWQESEYGTELSLIRYKHEVQGLLDQLRTQKEANRRLNYTQKLRNMYALREAHQQMVANILAYARSAQQTARSPNNANFRRELQQLINHLAAYCADVEAEITALAEDSSEEDRAPSAVPSFAFPAPTGDPGSRPRPQARPADGSRQRPLHDSSPTPPAAEVQQEVPDALRESRDRIVEREMRNYFAAKGQPLPAQWSAAPTPDARIGRQPPERVGASQRDDDRLGGQGPGDRRATPDTPVFEPGFGWAPRPAPPDAREWFQDGPRLSPAASVPSGLSTPTAVPADAAFVWHADPERPFVFGQEPPSAGGHSASPPFDPGQRSPKGRSRPRRPGQRSRLQPPGEQPREQRSASPPPVAAWKPLRRRAPELERLQAARDVIERRADLFVGLLLDGLLEDTVKCLSGIEAAQAQNAALDGQAAAEQNSLLEQDQRQQRERLALEAQRLADERRRLDEETARREAEAARAAEEAQRRAQEEKRRQDEQEQRLADELRELQLAAERVQAEQRDFLSRRTTTGAPSMTQPPVFEQRVADAKRVAEQALREEETVKRYMANNTVVEGPESLYERLEPWRITEILADEILATVVSDIADEMNILCDRYVDNMIHSEFADPV